MQGLEAASSPGCGSAHWTASPEGTSGLDWARIYVNVRQMAVGAGTAMEAEQPAASRETQLGGRSVARYCCPGREPSCESTPCRCSWTQELGRWRQLTLSQPKPARADCSSPRRNTPRSSEGGCQCGLVSWAAQPCSARAPLCSSLLFAGLLRGRSSVVCKERGCRALESLLWRVRADTEVCICAGFSLFFFKWYYYPTLLILWT